ncbi:hypothetical protein [uncultured Helicobacter sp.]
MRKYTESSSRLSVIASLARFNNGVDSMHQARFLTIANHIIFCKKLLR